MKMLFLRPLFLSVWLTTRTLALKELEIPRVAAPSLAYFYEHHADKEVPVIITNYSESWRGMTREHILQSCGSLQVPIASLAKFSSKDRPWAGIVQDDSGNSLSEAVQIVENRSHSLHTHSCKKPTTEKGHDKGTASFDTEQVGADRTVGVFDFSLARHCPELLQKHYVVPKYLVRTLAPVLLFCCFCFHF